MRQKTKNHQNLGLIDRKVDIFFQSLSQTGGSLSVKNPSEKSHAWAPLTYAVNNTVPVTTNVNVLLVLTLNSVLNVYLH